MGHTGEKEKGKGSGRQVQGLRQVNRIKGKK
jgi:hypothetical protein